jgi:hypothetical protein
MHWEVIEIGRTPRRFLTSDRPVEMYLMKEQTGSITLTISPTKLFVAVNGRNHLNTFCRQKHREVDQINKDHISRARHFVWATILSHSQNVFIRSRITPKCRRHRSFRRSRTIWYPEHHRTRLEKCDIFNHH